MKQMKFKLLVLALIFGSMYALAQPGNGSGNYAANCTKSLDLTQEQLAKVDELKATHLESMNTYRADLKIKKAELDKLEIAEKTDLGAINAKIDEISAIKTNMSKEQAKHRQDVRAILTAEQRAQFDARKRPGHGYKQGHGPHGAKEGKGYGPGCPYAK